MLRHVAIQRFLITALLMALVAMAARLLAIQGWIIPARVTSGSMADWLCGEHFWVQCGECKFRFSFGVESKPRSERAVCPNCGWDANAVRSEGRRRGQQVLIDRGAYWFSRPKRFDAVAFYDPQRPTRLIVKRVVGLPGEEFAIQEGELFVNGELVRKSLAQARPMAALVHDNRYVARHGSEVLHRWQPHNAATGWVTKGDGFEWSAPQGDAAKTDDRSELDWLVYHHWRCYASPYPRSQPAPISDNNGYNQGESRTLQNVTDVRLQYRVSSNGPGRLAVRIHDGREWFTVWINPTARQAEIKRGAADFTSASFQPDTKPELFEVEFGLLDQQVVLAMDSIELIRRPYDPVSRSATPIAQPIAIGSDELHVFVSNLMIKRDVYYLDPANVGQPWQLPQPIPADTFFMLGDNPWLSQDSRHWKGFCIPSSAIRGKVITY